MCVEQIQSFQKAPEGSLTLRHGLQACRRDFVIPLCAAPASRRWIAETRREEALVLQSFEGRLQCARCDLPLRPVANLITYTHAIRPVTQTQYRENDDLFEFADEPQEADADSKPVFRLQIWTPPRAPS